MEPTKSIKIAEDVLTAIKNARLSLMGKTEDMSTDDKIIFMSAHAQLQNQRANRIQNRAAMLGELSQDEKEEVAAISIKNAAAYEILSIMMHIDAAEALEKKNKIDEEKAQNNKA